MAVLYALGRATYCICLTSELPINWLGFERTYRSVSPSHRYVLEKLPRA